MKQINGTLSINQPLRCGIIFLSLAVALLLPQHIWARPINVGSISVEAAAEIKKFLPLASYLAKELQSEGIDQGKVVVAKGVSQMAALLREGKVDIFIDSPFPTLAASQLSGSKLLLRRWKKGQGEYHSVIFTRKDSDVNRLEDLKGKMVAFQDPFSTTSYFLPKTMLLQKGLKLALKTDTSESVAPGEVGYVFSVADENIILWVLRKKVIAGAIDDLAYEKEAKNLNSLKVIEKSNPVPRHIVSYRADLPPKLVARIKEILTSMDQSEGGKKALKDFESTTKFDVISDQSMAPLLKAVKHFNSELGVK